MSAQAVLAVMDSVPELITLAACDPMNDKLTGCNQRVREARVTVAELIEACSSTVEYNRGVGFFVVKADGDTPLSGKAHLYRNEAVQEREAAIDAALARAGGES